MDRAKPQVDQALSLKARNWSRRAFCLALLAGFALSGCQSGPGGNGKPCWTEERLPSLPEGTAQIGVARPFFGLVHGGEILLAGGSNFPGIPAADGGPKVCHDEIYLRDSKGRWTLRPEKLLQGPVAEGIPVTTPQGIACIGGMDGKADLATAFLMRWDPKAKKIAFSALPSFPKTVRMGAGACRGPMLYVACGRQDAKVANGFYRLDLEHPENGWVALPSLPGVPREQPVAGIANDAQGRPTFYVFGGNGIFPDGSNAALVDGYAYALDQGDQGSWTEAPPVRPAGSQEEVSLLGAAAIVRDGRWLVCEGGFDKGVWDETSRKIASLSGEALAAYKKGYLAQDPAIFRWNRRLLAFDAATGQWTATRPVPFLPRCGAAFVELPNGDLVVASGEIKPGTRTPDCEVLSNWPLPSTAKPGGAR